MLMCLIDPGVSVQLSLVLDYQPLAVLVYILSKNGKERKKYESVNNP